MKKKNGFISMSIIYSFFAVFTLVSSSLLLIYSTNLSIVKEKNREIRNEITEKGNNSIMPFINLIVDGGFEEYSEHSANFNWGNQYLYNNVTNIYEWKAEIKPKQTVLRQDSGKGEWRSNNDSDDYLRRLIMGSDANKYSGYGAIGFKGREKDTGATGIHNMIQSNQTFHMYKDHYYYISRVYFAWGTFDTSEILLGLMKYPAASTNEDLNTLNTWEKDPNNWNYNDTSRYFNILDKAKGYDGGKIKKADGTYDYQWLRNQYYNTDISKDRPRVESGYCLGVNQKCADPKGALDCAHTPDWAKETNVGGSCTLKNDLKSNTNANTFESGIFRFDGEEGDYRLLIGEKFNDTNNSGVQVYYCTDNYILIDLNVSLQYDVDTLMLALEPAPGEDANQKAKYQQATLKIDEMLDGRYFEGSKVFSKARFKLI